MNVFLATLILLVFLGLSSTLNPVKLSFTLILLSMVMFILLLLGTGSVWMCSVFFMIFIGGIMIMFMILSSLLPNEKVLKIKKILSLSWMFLLLVVGTPNSPIQMESGVVQETKLIFMSPQSFEVLMLVTFMYFLSFIYIISKETSSLRSFVCQMKKTL